MGKKLKPIEGLTQFTQQRKDFFKEMDDKRSELDKQESMLTKERAALLTIAQDNLAGQGSLDARAEAITERENCIRSEQATLATRTRFLDQREATTRVQEERTVYSISDRL